jgi:hypothetical protein
MVSLVKGDFWFGHLEVVQIIDVNCSSSIFYFCDPLSLQPLVIHQTIINISCYMRWPLGLH